MDANPENSATRRKQAERSALSDTRMLDAAVALIGQRGTAGVTLKDVGELAGYSRAMAGWRFGTKAALFAFVVRAVGEDWLQALGDAVSKQQGLAAIHAATDAHFRFMRAGADRTRAFYLLWFDSTGPDPELRQVIAHIHERRQRDVEAWITAGIEAGRVRADADVRSIAAHFCATIIGIVYHWLINPQALKQLQDLHEGLKQQMTRALAP
jgi:AcrR family transcriptional regulator